MFSKFSFLWWMFSGFFIFLFLVFWLRWTRMMSDYKVEMINDGMQEFYVEFHGPKESKKLFFFWAVYDLSFFFFPFFFYMYFFYYFYFYFFLGEKKSEMILQWAGFTKIELSPILEISWILHFKFIFLQWISWIAVLGLAVELRFWSHWILSL